MAVVYLPMITQRNTMKLAIITCSKLPQGVADDQPLLTSLNRLGINTQMVAWDAAVDWSSFDACLLRSVWDYHERLSAFNQWLDDTAEVTRLMNPPSVVKWNQNKRYLRDLSEFGVLTLPTTWISHAQAFELKQWSQNHPAQQTYFLKPVVGADSSGTLRFTIDDQGLQRAQQHLDQWLPEIDMMLQPYLSQVERFGETSVIYFGGQRSHAVRKIPMAGDYRVQDTFGAADVAYQPNVAEIAQSQACLQYLEQNHPEVLYARFDFLHDEAGHVYLNEAELIEPSLFFNHSETAADLFAEMILSFLSNNH